MNVLVLPDLHAPCMADWAIPFAKKLKRQYKCDTVVGLGDMIHNNAISFYARDPKDPSAVAEYEATKVQLAEVAKAFPKMMVCYGNHDRRVQRKASDAGIPDLWLRDINDVYGLPKTWEWDVAWELDNVFYCHGDRMGGGLNPAFNQAKRMGKSVVAGHFHTRMGVQWDIVGGRRVFGMQVGCAIDAAHPLHQYHPKYMGLEQMGMAVVVDGHPILVPYEP